MTPAVCSDPSMMEGLRFLLGLGLSITGAVLLFDYIRYMNQPVVAKGSTTYCPLHRMDRDKCEQKHKD